MQEQEQAGQSRLPACLPARLAFNMALCTHIHTRAGAQVNDAGTVIPANSIVEANQSGLIAEPLVDITPQLPLPHYT